MTTKLINILNLLCEDETIEIYDDQCMTNIIYTGCSYHCKSLKQELLNRDVFQIIGHDDKLTILLRGE